MRSRLSGVDGGLKQGASDRREEHVAGGCTISGGSIAFAHFAFACRITGGHKEPMPQKMEINSVEDHPAQLPFSFVFEEPHVPLFPEKTHYRWIRSPWLYESKFADSPAWEMRSPTRGSRLFQGCQRHYEIHQLISWRVTESGSCGARQCRSTSFSCLRALAQ